MVQPIDRERVGVTVHMYYAFMAPEEVEIDTPPTLVVYDDDDDNDDDKKAMWPSNRKERHRVLSHIWSECWISRATRARS